MCLRRVWPPAASSSERSRGEELAFAAAVREPEENGIGEEWLSAGGLVQAVVMRAKMAATAATMARARVGWSRRMRRQSTQVGRKKHLCGGRGASCAKRYT